MLKSKKRPYNEIRSLSLSLCLSPFLSFNLLRPRRRSRLLGPRSASSGSSSPTARSAARCAICNGEAKRGTPKHCVFCLSLFLFFSLSPAFPLPSLSLSLPLSRSLSLCLSLSLSLSLSLCLSLNNDRRNRRHGAR